jgi:hypothetical protein
MCALSLKSPHIKIALHATHLPPNQSTSPAETTWGMRILWSRSKHQSCQGATVTKQSYFEKTFHQIIMDIQTRCSILSILEPPNEGDMPRLALIFRLPKDWRTVNLSASTTIGTHNQVLLDHTQRGLLELKAPNWREWAFTKISCIANKETQSIGAGVYHPQSNTNITATCGGTSIDKTINRVEQVSRSYCCALQDLNILIAMQQTCSASPLLPIKISILWHSAWNNLDTPRCRNL